MVGFYGEEEMREDKLIMPIIVYSSKLCDSNPGGLGFLLSDRFFDIVMGSKVNCVSTFSACFSSNILCVVENIMLSILSAQRCAEEWPSARQDRKKETSEKAAMWLRKWNSL